MPAKEARRMDLFMQYGVAAGVQAIADSGTRGHRRESRAHRPRHGRRHRRARDDRGELRQVPRDEGPKKISPFYIPASIVNMISGPPVDHVRDHGAEPRRHHGLHDLDPRDRHRHAHDPVRRRGRRDRRRRRDGADADRGRRLLPGAGAVDAQRRAHQGEPAVGSRPRRLRDGRRRGRHGARGIRDRRRSAARASMRS